VLKSNKGFNQHSILRYTEKVLKFLDEEITDHVVWQEKNRYDYKLSIVARLTGPRVSNVLYLVRLESPYGESLQYALTLDGFKKLGELLVALHDFCQLPIYADAKNVDSLKKLLNDQNIKAYTQISALKSSKQQK
jgi:hypothetical protein